jgi:hypothetical protein
MFVVLHALVLMVIPVITLVLLLVQGDRERRLGIAVLTAALGLGVQALVYAYHTDARSPESNPLSQFVVLGGSTLAALLWLHSGRLRGLLFAVNTVALVVLCQHYVELVQGPRWAGQASTRLERQLPRIRDYLEVQGYRDDGVYPPGRVRDQPFAEDLPEWFRALLEPDQRDLEHSSRWHSWLTRLYRVERTPRDLMFPGGTLREGGPRVDLAEVGPAALAPARPPASQPASSRPAAGAPPPPGRRAPSD